MRMGPLAYLLIAAALASCAPGAPREALAPEGVRLAALKYAERYAELGAVYEWGAQDPLPRRLAVDCSGLVVRCYGYASEDFGYSLPFADMTAEGMRGYCSVVEPEPGDLIFMGEGGVVSHVAIYVGEAGARISFIDATMITGIVSLRSYEAGDPKFISFGRLTLLR